MHQFTAISKKRACTQRAATADRIKALNEKMANMCDIALVAERNRAEAKAERRARREQFKQARLARKKNAA